MRRKFRNEDENHILVAGLDWKLVVTKVRFIEENDPSYFTQQQRATSQHKFSGDGVSAYLYIVFKISVYPKSNPELNQLNKIPT